MRIGASGFSYDDWRGPFYPARLAKARMLEHYARHFDTVEVNSTYYRLPPPHTFARMAERVPPGFVFAVKAPGDVTHGEAPASVFVAFRECVAPLRERDMLGPILAQFPERFRPGQDAADRLRLLADELGDLDLVAEFRHEAWAGEETLDLLRELRIGFCVVDEPPLPGLMPPLVAVTSPIGYARFHGRNAAKWRTHEHAWERYDYEYTEAQLAEWVPRLKTMAATARESYVYFNNHHEGQAARNAEMLARLLGVALPVAVPAQGALPF